MSRSFALGIAIAFFVLSASRVPAVAGNAPDRPNGGTLRLSVEPFEASARLVPAHGALSKLLASKLNCEVELSIPSSYNAEIEAMRNGKLDVGEFGPLGYVLAYKIARADVVATMSGSVTAPSFCPA